MKLRKIRVLALRVTLIPILFLFLFISPTWNEGSAPEFLMEITGYLLLMAGLALRVWSSLYIGARKSKQLVSDGPYSLCRNPLYLGTFGIVLGAGLSVVNLPMAVFIVAVYIPVHVLVSRAEERHLDEIFGQQYQDYRRRTPFFLPSLRGFHTREEITVSARAIRRVAGDASLVVLIPLVGELLELLRAHHLMPVLWQFP